MEPKIAALINSFNTFLLVTHSVDDQFEVEKVQLIKPVMTKLNDLSRVSHF